MKKPSEIWGAPETTGFDQVEKTKLEQIREKARNEATIRSHHTTGKDYFFFNEKDLNSLITEAWNEAIKECEGQREKEAYLWFNNWYEAAINKRLINGDVFGTWASKRLQELGVSDSGKPLLPRANTTSDK